MQRYIQTVSVDITGFFFILVILLLRRKTVKTEDGKFY